MLEQLPRFQVERLCILHSFATLAGFRKGILRLK